MSTNTTAAPTKPVVFTRQDFSYFAPLTTRWADNDIYGHVNNVMYYSYFDSTANRYLIEQGGLDIHAGSVIGLVVDSGCSYFAPVAFPEQLEGALRVAHLGRSSVRYELAIFKNDQQSAVAQGHFVHVFVDRQTRQAVSIPDSLRQALAKLMVNPAS
ncbi:acyl-CoA thioesterase [Alkanindiges sp. WGS2144]|uniref:acyl-CoA thioesterase n=1 Tax=Alkanindiges sp. WGS2144 TaxID=3366808 RepID=UPI0037532DA2